MKAATLAFGHGLTAARHYQPWWPAVARSRRHLGRGTMPDLLALVGEHLAAGSAKADGGPPAFLLKAIGTIPGMARLLRLVMNLAYRSGLRKEGYEDA
ncbi:hypothetical protein [Actinoplanes sp. NPDC026623]|uniref:hypothetical protein n=1 Tax=Actinoplanes sp. NPDC026623 TaxID=3155610 RepID=UPI00340476E5